MRLSHSPLSFAASLLLIAGLAACGDPSPAEVADEAERLRASFRPYQAQYLQSIEIVNRLIPLTLTWLNGAATLTTTFTLGGMFWTFFKIGSVLFGSGYVLLAYLRADFVERLGWLSEAQLLDAVALGQALPGPIFTTATFIGYVLGGLPGGAVATVGIFLPSFFFVLLSHRIVSASRRHPVLGAFLDGLNAASLALMAVVTAALARVAVLDFPSAVISLSAAGAILWWRVQPGWVLAGGAVAGLLLRVLAEEWR